jgi:RNA polymerase sigma factor for flagellar operon FliA
MDKGPDMERGSANLSMDKRRQQLVVDHVKCTRALAVQAIRKYGLPMSLKKDLAAYGCIGLIEASKTFDFDRGVKFKTYAEWRIGGAIEDGLKTWRKGRQLLTELRGAPSADATIAEPIDRAIERMSRVVVIAAHDKLAADAGQVADADALTPETAILKNEQVERVTELLQELNPRRREILRLAFFEEMKGVDIARALGMDKTSVTHMRNRALAALRKQMNDDEEGCGSE